MGFLILKHELVNCYHVPDTKMIQLLPATPLRCHNTSYNGNFIWFGEAAPLSMVKPDDIVYEECGTAADGLAAPTGSKASARLRHIPDLQVRETMQELDAKHNNGNFKSWGWCDINMDNLTEECSFTTLLDQLRRFVESRAAEETLTGIDLNNPSMAEWESLGSSPRWPQSLPTLTT